MSQERLKIEVAEAALRHVEDGMVLGVGTGSTVNAFIRALAASGKRLQGAVSSSDDTTRRLEEIGVDVLDLNHTGDLALDRKSTRLNSSHVAISYAVFCLKK